MVDNAAPSDDAVISEELKVAVGQNLVGLAVFVGGEVKDEKFGRLSGFKRFVGLVRLVVLLVKRRVEGSATVAA